jgi:CRP/FNR family cyclic AMP-dependent transcriptional regulator
MAKKPDVSAALKGKLSFDPKLFKAAGRSLSKYRKDQIVFSQDDPADALFYIEKGLVKVSHLSKQGKNAVVAILGAGHYIGEECLAGRPQRLMTVTAITESSILRLENAELRSMLQKESNLSEILISYFASRKIQVEDDLLDQLLNSSEKRLARRLLLLANWVERTKPLRVRFSQHTLAAMIGTTQSRVSFFMSKFRHLGLIDYNGDLKIDTARLREFAQE